MMAVIVTQVLNLISEILGEEIWEFNSLHVLATLHGMRSVGRGLVQYTWLKPIGIQLSDMQSAIFNHFLLMKAKISYGSM